MTIDEICQIIQTGEEMDLADMRLAFRVVFGRTPPVGWLRNELMGRIEDRVRYDHPEQFDDLNHAELNHAGPGFVQEMGHRHTSMKPQ
jgi:hypothetical protein